ncbi:MAG TPA: lipopolysaccharide core heptose(I) kinase RfaP, partial [Kiloniellales bacterium]|nr:lipopolysaccharide core heptose(I) kinase RfaP [Kiloniellales bacterium]
ASGAGCRSLAAMRVAIVLHRDFPTGGLQRDARALALALLRRGHQVALISREAEGEPPAGVERRLVPAAGASNHARDLAFAAAYRQALQPGERVVGFDKLPGLDLYFAADLCWRDRAGLLQRLSPRGRARLALEAAVCGSEGPPIAVLTAEQRAGYARAWNLPLERFLLLPPLRDAAYRPKDDQGDLTRAAARRALALPEKGPIALFVGRDAQLKGLDRVLAALAAQGDAAPLLLCVGEPTARHRRQAAALGERVALRGGGELALCYAAADLLLHPARREAGGKVIAEALGHGLAVLCSAACGYAGLVAESGAGAVLPEPFRQDDLNLLLARALRPGQLACWQARARAAAPQLFAEEGIEHLADIVERLPARAAPASAARGIHVAAGAEALLPADGDAFAWLFALSGEGKRRQARRETLAVTLNGERHYLKRHGGAGWRELAKNWLTLKPPVLGAGEEWRALNGLAALEIAAPRALVYAARGLDPSRRRSAVLMAALPAGEAVEDRVQRPPALTTRERHALLRRIAHTVRRMHGGGIAHRDLYLCHVFELSDGRIALLDLHRAILARPLPERWIAKDLAALAWSSLPYGLSGRDRLRFLSAYHGLPLRIAARRFAGLWRDVDRRIAGLQARGRRMSG